ncbi:HWE histidine kinase domain-containing protein, partial [Paracoccus sp. (in: a-proteobacteria)]|uniref:HWE histidine kinase domain-containing protein n=1 Tax=Paracoccus sp. TaxID=267 RepID=UPI00396C89F2
MLAGDSYYSENARYTPDRDGTAKEAFFTHSHSPIWDDTGAVCGIFLTVVETTARLEAEARNELLMDELKHRIKNMLAVVQAIVNQSLRRAENKDDVAAIIRGQISALGRAHDLLTKSAHVDAPLAAIVMGSLDIHGPYAGRVAAGGPAITLVPQAAIALTMVLHEL